MFRRSLCAIALSIGVLASACTKKDNAKAEYPPLIGAPEDPSAKPGSETEKKSSPKSSAPLVSTSISTDAPSNVAEPPPEAKKTPKGVSYVVIKAGTGERPKAYNEVVVHYAGWTTDGKLFDDSMKRGKPATFPVNAVIPGWTEVLQLMSEGSVWRVWIPEEMAYKGSDGAPAGMLVFDVQLIAIAK